MAVSHTEPVSGAVISAAGFGIPASRRITDTGTLAARPVSGTVDGQFYFATDTDQLFVWNGSAWIVESEPWTSFTPLFGPGGIAYTLSYGMTWARAVYKRSRGLCTIHAHGNIANLYASPNSSPFAFGSLPFPMAGGSELFGQFGYLDDGTAWYNGWLRSFGFGPVTGGMAGGSVANGAAIFMSPNEWGLAAFPAVGDGVWVQLEYSVAT
jgi:hypothetical protein